MNRPRILYAGIADASGTLQEIVAQLETSLAELDSNRNHATCPPSDTWTHTKCIKGGKQRGPDGLTAEENGTGSMQVDTLNLVASFLDKSGPTYQVMDTITLDFQ